MESAPNWDCLLLVLSMEPTDVYAPLRGSPGSRLQLTTLKESELFSDVSFSSLILLVKSVFHVLFLYIVIHNIYCPLFDKIP